MGVGIASAASEGADGRCDGEFPIDVYQTGSGTSKNMNANEVIASLASERLGRAVHPNDEVNASQSSNDGFPPAIHVAAARSARHALLTALGHLADVSDDQAEANADVGTAGRTHPMNATPVTTEQEIPDDA